MKDGTKTWKSVARESEEAMASPGRGLRGRGEDGGKFGCGVWGDGDDRVQAGFRRPAPDPAHTPEAPILSKPERQAW